MAALQRCTGSTTNQAVWVLQTSLQGQTINVPDFVNKVGPYLVQQICLQSPQDPANAFQAQLISADFNVAGVFTSPSTAGAYQFAGDFVPYAPGTTTVNPLGAMEWRTYVGLPSSLTMKRGKNRAGAATLSGKLTIAGLTPAGIKLDLFAGLKKNPAPNATSGGTGKRVARTKALRANGKYTIRVKPKKPTYYQMRFENYGLAGTCQGPSPSGTAIPCKGTDLAPMTSSQIRIRPLKRRR